MPLFGQTKFDSPYNAVMDTVSSKSKRITRDLYINPSNSLNGVTQNYGIVDLQIIHQVWNVKNQTTDTLTLEAYGIKRVRHSKVQGWASDGLTTYVTDSTRVGLVPVTTTATLSNYALDLLFPQFYQFDGIRLVIKSNGVEEQAALIDSVKTWTQLRSYLPEVK